MVLFLATLHPSSYFRKATHSCTLRPRQTQDLPGKLREVVIWPSQWLATPWRAVFLAPTKLEEEVGGGTTGGAALPQ